jgi:1-acyl-sn-glycerol-3-phosphate acyltransferase
MSLWRLRALLITDPLIALAIAAAGTISLIASLFDPTGRAQHAVARAWGWTLLKIPGVKVRLEGLEKLTPDGSYVLVANHVSYMDIPVLFACLPLQIRFLAKKSLFKVPFIGFHLKRAGHIAVPREDSRASLKTLAESARLLRERGVSLLIFAEGGRSPGAMRDFKEGAAYIAIKAGVPVVPVGLIGTRQVLPMNSLLVRGGPVTLRVGDPIPTDGRRVHDHEALTRQLRARVWDLAGEGYGG